MKKLLFFLVVLSCSACATYPRLKGSVRMNYAVHINDTSGLLGYVLCEKYKYAGDTMILFNAGYYPKLRWQRTVTNIIYYGNLYQFSVIDINGSGSKYKVKPGTDPIPLNEP